MVVEIAAEDLLVPNEHLSYSPWARSLVCGRKYAAQRSPSWFAVREEYFFSGSNAKTALGHAAFPPGEQIDALSLACGAELDFILRLPTIKATTKRRRYGNAWYRVGEAMPDVSAVARAVLQLQHAGRVPSAIPEPGPDDTLDTMHMLRGTKCESFLTQINERLYGIDIADVGLVPHPTLAHVGASPDGVAVQPIRVSSGFGAVGPFCNPGDDYPAEYERTLFEFKVPARLRPDAGTDEWDLFAGYNAQMQLQMACTGADCTVFSRMNWDEFKMRFAMPDSLANDVLDAWVESSAAKLARFTDGEMHRLVENRICLRDSGWITRHQPEIERYISEVKTMRAEEAARKRARTE
jgi:hypothetical protein